MKAEIRKATIKDIKAMKGKLRREDCLEIFRLYGVQPYKVLLRSFQRSRKRGVAYIGLVDGEIACAWGVVKESILSHKSRIWLLSTDVMDKAPVQVAIRTKRELRKIMQEYPYLENDVDYKYQKCLQWLHWLGFIIEEPRPLGLNNELFSHFYLNAMESK